MLNDVNLEQWSASNDGTQCSFRFRHRHGGAPAGVLQCIDVILFSYQNIQQASQHPIYVKTMAAEELTGELLLARLRRLQFRFVDSSDAESKPWEQRRLVHVQLDGGYLHIDVVCRDFRLTQIEAPLVDGEK